ncbi:sugar transferase, partial [Anaerolineales bacterium HSG24]|nr:sugar transferase [Anaerolineales bacterium HSG24]
MFRRVGIRLILITTDLSTIIIALMIASWLRPQLEFGKPLPVSSVSLAWSVYLLALGVWFVSFSSQDVYNLQKNLRVFDELQRLISAHTLTVLAFAGVLYFSFRDISRLQILTFTAISMGLLLIGRVAVRAFLQLFGNRRYGTRRVLIIGAGQVGQHATEMVAQNSWTGLVLSGFVDDNPEASLYDYPHFGNLDQTLKVIKTQRINEVIFALPRHAHHKLANMVAELEHAKVNMRIVPDVLDLVFLRSIVEDFGGMPLITLQEPALDPLQRFVKRSFDVIVTSLTLLLAIPLMAIITVLIKLDSSGPAVFIQQRVGEQGLLFKMYKFRTMHHPQHQSIRELPSGSILHKSENDPRITRLGRFLRRTSLDELPQ